MRTDSASRVIAAPAEVIYAALLDPGAMARWRPPAGMRCEVHTFDAREGGGFCMTFAYSDAGHAVAGKTSKHADVFEGRFVELVPDARVVERIDFVSEDPAFFGPMTVVTSLTPVAGGTEVTITCKDVPSGIRREDHQVGLRSTLANLAAYTEHGAQG
ncbi:SRPBCC family protein [Algiphilus aromaticivorans]|jgi:uncharacterized protein YndB with AHSA1/START domain|uniref:SRPBCC family protein n=1 Tax=Algiphilus aromaticivorans TaxID=382454 RepID=UPI0005C1477D|nr:SRPBCC family protein [Algiphilus aromaticivorans]